LNNFSAKSLQRLVAYYKEKNGIDVITTAPLPLRLAAVDKRRQQLIAEDVIEYMKNNYPNYVLDPNAIIIGVTDEDMYIRNGTRNTPSATVRRDDSPSCHPHAMNPSTLESPPTTICSRAECAK
jgi:hypothetical protein